MPQDAGASAKADRATRPADQAAERLGDTASVPSADRDAYVGRYLREFERQFSAYPSVDLRSALQAADAQTQVQSQTPHGDSNGH